MTTTSFLITVAAVYFIHWLVLFWGKRVALKSAFTKIPVLLQDEAEQKNLRLLPYFGNAIFALLFGFLIFQVGEATGEIDLWDGLLYGLAVGMLVYLPQGLLIIATFARVREIVMRSVFLGVFGSMLSGLAVSFIL